MATSHRTPNDRETLLAAIAAARETTRGWTSVVSVGLGFKHRRIGGYGRRRTPSVTFVVRRKTDSPPAGERIPETLRFVHRGVEYGVATDVRSVSRGVRHLLPQERLISPDDAGYGSPGFLLRNDSGAAWLLTAGHVLMRGTKAPDNGDRVGLGFAAPYVDVGFVLGPLSHIPLGAAQAPLLDVGVVRLATPVTPATRAALDVAPLNAVRSILTLDELIDAHLASEKPRYRLHTANGAPVSASFAWANFSSYDTVVDENGVDVARSYAAVSVVSESGTGKFRAGDSGGALVDEDGRLFGIHILGLGGGGSTRKGLAVFAETILSVVRERLGDPSVRLARTSELP